MFRPELDQGKKSSGHQIGVLQDKVKCYTTPLRERCKTGQQNGHSTMLCEETKTFSKRKRDDTSLWVSTKKICRYRYPYPYPSPSWRSINDIPTNIMVKHVFEFLPPISLWSMSQVSKRFALLLKDFHPKHPAFHRRFQQFLETRGIPRPQAFLSSFQFDLKRYVCGTALLQFMLGETWKGTDIDVFVSTHVDSEEWSTDSETDISSDFDDDSVTSIMDRSDVFHFLARAVNVLDGSGREPGVAFTVFETLNEDDDPAKQIIMETTNCSVLSNYYCGKNGGVFHFQDLWGMLTRTFSAKKNAPICTIQIEKSLRYHKFRHRG